MKGGCLCVGNSDVDVSWVGLKGTNKTLDGAELLMCIDAAANGASTDKVERQGCN